MMEEQFCLHQRFERQVEIAPTAPALSFSGETLTYYELNARANRLASYLRGLGIRQGDLIGLCLDRGFDTVVAILAVLKAGCAYVPMDPIYPTDRVRGIVEDAACPLVLCHAEHEARFTGGGARVLVLDGAEQPWQTASDANLPGKFDASSLAYVIYTSGSTGKPKGAVVSHRNVYRLFTAMQPDFDFSADDVWTFFHSYAFDFSVSEMWGALFFGGRIVMVPHLVSRSPEAFYQLLLDERVTVLNQTPSAFKQLQHHDETVPIEISRGLALRYVLVGGEYMALSSLAPWFERHGDDRPKIIHVYGITETTVFVTWRALSKVDAAPGTPSFIGRELSDLYIHVLDENRRPVALGEIGELYVGGPGVCLGYLNRPELTAERFIPDPLDSTTSQSNMYKSGDLVRLLDGDLEFIGRNDSQIQLRGFRIELGEIEAALSEAPGVRSAVVRLREDTPGDQRLVAYYLAKNSLSIDVLRDHLHQTLPGYMVPSAFVHLEQFPLNNNGKVDNAALPIPTYCHRDFVAPTAGLETDLATIWSEVLHVGQVGATDNFFALGGHSLLATRILIRIHEKFGVNLSLRSLYEAPTIRDLAPVIDQAANAGDPASENPLPRVPRTGMPPLSFAQEQLWVLDQLRPGLCAYNVPMRIELKGTLRRELLEPALALIAARHEALRTLLVTIDGTPHAKILPELAVPVGFQRLASLSESAREEALRREAKSLAGTPMVLDRGPLVHGTLFELSERHHVLVLVIHHVIFDGWSISVLLSELASAYGALAEGTSWNAPPLDYQYADYAAWQRSLISSHGFQTDLDYWKEQLAPPLAVQELPLDFGRPAIQTWEGARIRHILPPDTVGKLNTLAQELGTTIFVVLLAGWKSMLFRSTGQEDCIVGTAMAGRSRREWESLIGFFATTVALRTRIGRDIPFSRLVDRVQEVTIGAQDHQQVPFERVVANAQNERDPSRPPLFPTMVVLHNTPDYDTSHGDLQLSAEEMDNGCAKFELTLAIQPAADTLVLDLEYNTGLFKAETAALLLARFESLMLSALEDPSCTIGRLRLGSDQALSTVVSSAPTVIDPAITPASCLHQQFEAQVQRTPDAIAVKCEDTVLSYRELNAQANRLARHLQTLGVGPEILVGLCLDRSTDIAIAILAVLKAGGAYVPMDPVYPAERVRIIVEDAQCPVVIAQTAHAARFRDNAALVLVLDGADTPWEQGDDTDLPCMVVESNLAYAIYTSGSTGRPKGALITHKNVNVLMRGMENWLRFDGSDVWTLFHSYAFDFSVWEIWGALLYGGRLIIVPHLVSRSPAAFYQLLIREGVTVLNQTPSAFRQLQHYDETLPIEESRLLILRYVILSGETLDLPGLAGWFERHGDHKPELINIYGITETTVFVTYRPVTLADTRPGTPNFIGVAIPGYNLYVLDENRRPVATGNTGELYVGGGGVSRGYLRRPELTAERFVPDPNHDGDTSHKLYKTGDLVRVHENDLEYLGRNDMQVQLRGFRVELGEIEAAINAYPPVRGAVVRMREDTPGDQRLVAYYLADSPVPLADLRDHLATTLPAYMMPAYFDHMQAFPLNSNGKIDAGALPAPGGGGFNAPADAEPITEMQARIAAIWSELLGIPDVGLHSNFFALGGHSLLAIQVMNRINASLNANLAVVDFFESPTVAGLARRLDPAIAENDTLHRAQLLEIKPGTRTPFFCVKGAGDVGGSYITLAGALSDSQAFYGFPNLEFSEDVSGTVENLATQCIAEMKRVRPEGPYYLGGYSFGGIVAYEMAQQLISAGDDVPLIAMFDSAVLEHHSMERSLSREYLWHLKQRVRIRIVTFARTWKMQIGYLRDGFLEVIRRATSGHPMGENAPRLSDYLKWMQLDTSVQYYLIHAGLAKQTIGERRLRMVEEQMVKNSAKSMSSSKEAMAQYEMKPIPAEVTLFRAEYNPWRSELRDPTYGWSRYAQKGVKVIVVPGNHMVIIRHPYTSGLGKALQKVIDEIAS